MVMVPFRPVQLMADAAPAVPALTTPMAADAGIAIAATTAAMVRIRRMVLLFEFACKLPPVMSFNALGD